MRMVEEGIQQQVTFTKFLRVILDDKLKWTRHIFYIKNKIRYGYYTKSQKGSEVILKLYQSSVTPYIIYCLEIW